MKNKRYIVTGGETWQKVDDNQRAVFTVHVGGGDKMQVSDGYHTMDELYEHRSELFLTLARLCRRQELKVGTWPDQPFVWRSKRHGDGELCFGTGTQFVLGIGNFEGQQITYHLPIERWGETEWAETLERAPRYDGHSSADVLKRLKLL